MGEAGPLRILVGAALAAAPFEGTDAANAAMRGGGVKPRPYDDPGQ